MVKIFKKNTDNKLQDKTLGEKRKAAKTKRSKLEADYYNSALVGNANVVNHVLRKSSGLDDILAMTDSMLDQIKLLNKGDMNEVETILLTQAHALQAIFVNAATQMAHADYMSKMQVWAQVALKAQSQCRQTLATLADIKFPRQSATFIKQQNNAVNQQVNNSQVEISKDLGIGKNELLSGASYEALDGSRTQAAGEINPQLETLETVNRG